jgi:outer membrane protein assembly factor BamB
MKPHSRLLLVVAAAVLAVAGCSSKGKTREPAKLVDIAKPGLKFHLAWVREVGNGSGGMYAGFRVALGEDAVYAASAGGEVAALQPDSGKRLWTTQTKARLISGPGIDGDTILVGTLDAQMIALKRSDGKELWRTSASSEVLAPPAGAGNTVVARCGDGRIFGFDVATGARTWSFDRTEPNLTLRGLSAPMIAEGHVFAGLDNGHVVALGLDDGQLSWDQPVSVPGGRTELDRLTDIDADLLPGPQGLFVVSYGSDLALLDPANGQSIWRRTVKSYTGMAVGDTRLFVTDADGLVEAFDTESGAALWKQDGLKYRQLSPPAFFNGYVVAGDYEGYLHWLSPEDGHFVARTRLSSYAITAPLVVGPKYLYAMDVEGEVAAIEAVPAH